MKRGLVIGKFMPIHEGHIAMIRYAAGLCDEVIVSMSYTAQDLIDPVLRFGWVKEIFKNDPTIHPRLIQDDFDDDSLPLEVRTKKWAEVIRQVYPSIDLIVSSEEYGAPFATHLGATHFPFDPERKNTPVSATLIRSQPFAYWDFIPAVVRPYFVKRICFYGPESTGKTVMAEKMAGLYQTEWVPEVARELITSNDFSLSDIVRIGHAQTARVLEKTGIANKLLFCDTDLITTQVYCNHYLHTVPPVLFELERQVQYAHYFFFRPDTPWVADDLRDLGDKRTEMAAVFAKALEERQISYTIVSGSWAEREAIILDKLKRLFEVTP